MRQIVGEFDLPARDIDEILIQTRHFEEVTIPGIALQPAKAS